MAMQAGGGGKGALLLGNPMQKPGTMSTRGLDSLMSTVLAILFSPVCKLQLDFKGEEKEVTISTGMLYN